MEAIYVTPKPINYWTTGPGVFNKTKKFNKAKKPRPHNGTLRPQYMKNKRKEQNRMACRQKFQEDIF